MTWRKNVCQKPYLEDLDKPDWLRRYSSLDATDGRGDRPTDARIPSTSARPTVPIRPQQKDLRDSPRLPTSRSLNVEAYNRPLFNSM